MTFFGFGVLWNFGRCWSSGVGVLTGSLAQDDWNKVSGLFTAMSGEKRGALFRNPSGSTFDLSVYSVRGAACAGAGQPIPSALLH